MPYRGLSVPCADTLCLHVCDAVCDVVVLDVVLDICVFFTVSIDDKCTSSEAITCTNIFSLNSPFFKVYLSFINGLLSYLEQVRPAACRCSLSSACSNI